MRLATWAGEQAQIRASELTEARQAAQATASQQGRAQAGFAEAATNLSRLRADATATAKADQEARTRLSELADRITELDRLLQGAPAEDELTAQLALRDELEAAAAGAEQRLLRARADRAAAEEVLASLEQAEFAARAHLSAARDPVVKLGAPALGGIGLLAAWTALANWAGSMLSSLDEEIVAARERAATARTSAEQLTSKLSAALAAGGVELAPEMVTAGASSAVAATLAHARGSNGAHRGTSCPSSRSDS